MAASIRAPIPSAVPTRSTLSRADSVGTARKEGRAFAHPTKYRRSGGLAEAIVEGVTGAAHGTDRVGLVAAVERLAQAADVHVDGAFVDVDLATPDAVEQLLAREHAAGRLHQDLEQAVLGGPEIDGAAAARPPLLLAVDLEVAEAEHVGEPLRQRAAQQRAHARAQLRHRERL